jgi:hypothetical protein
MDIRRASVDLPPAAFPTTTTLLNFSPFVGRSNIGWPTYNRSPILAPALQLHPDSVARPQRDTMQEHDIVLCPDRAGATCGVCDRHVAIAIDRACRFRDARLTIGSGPAQ